MKYIVNGILLILWILVTFLLAITLIGIVVIAEEDTGWGDMGRKLVNNLS